MRPVPFETFIAPARKRPQLWRLLAGVVLVGAVYAGWIAGMAAVIGLLLAGRGGGPMLTAESVAQSPAAVLILLFSFLGLALGVGLAVRLLHGRGVATLFGRAPVVLRDFCAGIGVVALVSAVSVVFWPAGVELVAGVPPGQWLSLLPLALLGLLIQTGAEEMLFRGYLQQQLAARFRSAVIWMFLPSIGFGLLHHAPAIMGSNTWLVVAATAVFGLVAADLTARSGALGLAWGLHFANNVMALLIVGAGSGLEGLALYRLPEAAEQAATLRPLILIDIAVLVVIWGLSRLWLRAR